MKHFVSFVKAKSFRALSCHLPFLVDMKISKKISDFSPEAGERVKVTRKALGLTQEELAGLLGVTRGALANWERGSRLADVAAMTRFCRAYNLSLDWLYMGDMSQLPRALTKAILGKTLYQLEAAKQKQYADNVEEFNNRLLIPK